MMSHGQIHYQINEVMNLSTAEMEKLFTSHPEEVVWGMHVVEHDHTPERQRHASTIRFVPFSFLTLSSCVLISTADLHCIN